MHRFALPLFATSRPRLRRITLGLGSNAFAQLVNVAIQLLALPLFLSHWDAATYGSWLLLSALPTYVGMADAGMLAAVGNGMTMAIGRGDLAHARALLHSAVVFMAAVCTAVAIVVLPLALWLPVAELASPDRRIALALLIATVLLRLFLGGLADAMLRATGRYAQGVAWLAVVQLAGFGGQAIGLVAHGSLAAVALGGFIVQGIGLLWVLGAAARDSRGLGLGVSAARFAEIRALAGPALSFVVFPLSNALSVQGITLLVGHLLGPVAVAVFGSCRTLARVVVQGSGLLSHALWPEFSRLYGQGGAAAVAPLFRRASRWSTGFAVAVSLAVYAASPWILQAWTRGAIAFDPLLMALLLAYAAVAGIGHVPRVLLMATNQHVDLAKWQLAAAACGLGAGALLGGVGGLAGVALAVLVCETAITAACAMQARRLRGAGS